MISVCQIGGRMQYAVARIFDSQQLLSKLYTDLCFDKFPFSLIKESTFFSKYGSTRKVNIDPRHIEHFPLLAYQYYKNKQNANTVALEYQNYMWMEEQFGKKVISQLKNDESEYLYVFNTASRIIGKYKDEKKIILEQCSLPFGQYRKAIISEFEKNSGWCKPDAIYSYLDESVEQFILHEREEWINAEYIIVPSASVKDSLISEGVNLSKIILVPYGINFSTAIDLPDQIDRKRFLPFTVSTVGYLELRKGIHHFLNVAKAYPSAQFRAIGKQGNLIPDDKLSELKKYVELTGHLDRLSLSTEFQRTHVLLFLTIGEGSATVVYEALSLGIPVITTKEAGSIIEHEVNGFIIEPDNTSLIIYYLEKLKDLDYYRYISMNALARSQYGNFESYKNRLLENLNFVH